MHAPAQCAGKFFFCGTGLPTVMRKNQPLVPRSNFGRKACARTTPWLRGQTLPVPGNRGGGGGAMTGCWHLLEGLHCEFIPGPSGPIKGSGTNLALQSNGMQSAFSFYLGKVLRLVWLYFAETGPVVSLMGQFLACCMRCQCMAPNPSLTTAL